MNGENQKFKDEFSGASVFELIYHSDSETEGNGYSRLGKTKNNPSELFPSSKSYIPHTLENSELPKIIRNSKNEKIKLSLSQEQIFVLKKQNHHHDNKDRTVKKSYSTTFPNTFTIVPIKLSIDSVKVNKSNLPEIVLTSFETNSPDMSKQHPQQTHQGSLKVSNEMNTLNRNKIDNEHSLVAKTLILNKTLPYQMSIDLNPSSSSPAMSERGFEQILLHELKETISSDLKCRICDQLFKDPRTLNCLHSFCFQCLISENFGNDASISYWLAPDGISFNWKGNSDDYTTSYSANSTTDSDSQAPPRPDSRSSMKSYGHKKSSEKSSKDKNLKSDLSSKNSAFATATENLKILVCSICQYCTEMPIGGIRQLPKNFILARRIENIILNVGNNVMSNIWCSLCCEKIPATYHCLSCTINLCGFCKDAHERQRNTAYHNVSNLLELRKTRNSKHTPETPKIQSKCSLHPGFELKSFCTTCQQIICSDCTILLHKGHKFDSIHKIFKSYHKLIKESSEKTKPLSEYAAHSISKLEGISKKITQKCDQVQQEVEIHMAAYFEALEVHKRTLLQQITRARETKMQMILEHQLDLEKRSSQAKKAVEFCEELCSAGSEAEIVSFVNVLLKRFEFCSKHKPPLDAKISDTLHFLPEVRAPSTKAQNNIPLYGIITTQTVEPRFCTLETEGYDQLRVHRRAELTILSRDSDEFPLCHGGLTVDAAIKYKDGSSRAVPFQISDNRDGTYVISFIPDVAGVMLLSVAMNGKAIKGSPFVLAAKTVRAHTGIFHCCTFCSSKGSKSVKCACNGVMPGLKGCGHGHNGHPGRRHWSCCGSILENSECTTANKF